MATGSRPTTRSIADRYRRNYQEPEKISLTPQTESWASDNNNHKLLVSDDGFVEAPSVAAFREIKKVTLIDDRIPRDRVNTKTLYLGDTVAFNYSSGFSSRRLQGQIVGIVFNQFSKVNPNETVFRVRIGSGAIVNVRGYSLL